MFRLIKRRGRKRLATPREIIFARMDEMGWTVRAVADRIEGGDKLRNRALLATFMRRGGKLGGQWCDRLEEALGLPIGTLAKAEAAIDEVERAAAAINRAAGRKEV